MAWMRLGELLLGQNLCPQDKLKEAWDQKTLYGNRLGTNLLAIGAISEEALARTLGQQHQMNSAYGNLIQVQDGAVSLVSKELADIGNCVPHHVDGTTLYLLMMDPTHRQTLDAVRRATKMTIAPVIVCEARMWQLLQKHYGVSRGLRPIDLDTPQFMREAQAAAAAPEIASSGGELTSEEEFHAMYGDMNRPSVDAGPPGLDSLSGQEPVEEPAAVDLQAEVDAQAATLPAVPAVPVVLVVPAQPQIEDLPPTSIEAFATAKTQASSQMRPVRIEAPLEMTPPPVTMGAGEPFSPPPVTMGEAPEIAVTLPPEPGAAQPSSAQLKKTLFMPALSLESVPGEHQASSKAPAIPERPIAGPFSEGTNLGARGVVNFADAIEALREAHSRTEIAEIVLRYALNSFQRVALLTVHPAGIVGWKAFGDEDFTTAKLARFQLPLAERSVFSLVCESRSHFIGPLEKWKAHGEWVKATGRKIPKSVAVFPVLLHGNVINLLYGDNGHDAHVTADDVGNLLIMMQTIGNSYEALMNKRKM